MREPPLFHRLYGAALGFLPSPIIRVHDVGGVRTWRGQACVMQGETLPARALCRLLGFPQPGQAVPLTVVMTRGGQTESWRRSFGGHPMATRLRAGNAPHTVEETFWPFTAVSRLDPDGAGVTQVLVGFRVLGLTLPRTLWPKLEVREGADGTRYRFSIAVYFPWGALVGKYEGWLETNA